MIPRELVPGKLQIVRRIGVGGMGVVYEAIHLGLDRRVAVKVIHPQSSESSEARTRFFREARALALLRSEHIVQVLDVDTLPEGDPYMVMEYLEGRDLRRELVKRGPLPIAEAVGYLMQATTGIAAAHGAGVIHRDIKPANIFITNLDGPRRAKLLDFGVAKVSATLDPTLTGPTNRLGTPLYMSPEQIAGLEPDSSCDLWALGVVLFQLLTGHSPFRPKGNEGTVGAVLTGTATLLHEARADAPLELSRVVARCFERNHEKRFSDARELVAALAPFGTSEPTVRVSRRVPRGSSAPPPELPASHAVAERSVAKSPEIQAIRQAITLAQAEVALLSRAELRAQPAAAEDPEATIRFRSGNPVPTPAPRSLDVPAAPAVPAVEDIKAAPQPSPEPSRIAQQKRRQKRIGPLAAVLFLGLSLATGRALLSAVTRAGPVALSPSASPPPAEVELTAPEAQATSPAAEPLPAPASTAPEQTPEPPSSPGAAHSPPTHPARPSSAQPSRSETRPRAQPLIGAAPAPTSAPTPVPLHL